MWDRVWYSIFDIRFECWIEFDIRYSTFDLNVGLSLIFDIRHSIWMLDLVWYSIFDIQNLNVRLSLIFDIRSECWIQFDIRYSTFKIWMLNIEHLTKFWLLPAMTNFLFSLANFKTVKVCTIWLKYMVRFRSYEHCTKNTPTSQNDARKSLVTILHTSCWTMLNLIQIYHAVQELWAFSLTDHNPLEWWSANTRPLKRLLHMPVVR